MDAETSIGICKHAYWYFHLYVKTSYLILVHCVFLINTIFSESLTEKCPMVFEISLLEFANLAEIYCERNAFQVFCRKYLERIPLHVFAGHYLQGWLQLSFSSRYIISKITLCLKHFGIWCGVITFRKWENLHTNKFVSRIITSYMT